MDAFQGRRPILLVRTKAMTAEASPWGTGAEKTTVGALTQMAGPCGEAEVLVWGGTLH